MANDQIADNYISIEEAAEYLGVSVIAIRGWIKRKMIFAPIRVESCGNLRRPNLMNGLVVVKVPMYDPDLLARKEIKDANKSVFRDSVRYTIKAYSGYITMEEMHGQVRRNYGWRKRIGY